MTRASTTLARALALALLLAPLAAGAQRSQPQPLTVLGFTTTVPAGWTARTPSSSMRLAEFVVPSGRDSAEVVIYFFGPGQGGGVDANVGRWRSQFSAPAGQSVFERVVRDSSPASPLTIAEFRGSYARGTGAGSSPDAARPDHTLLATVAETPKGTVFIQMFGRSAAVESARAGYLQLVRGLK